MANAIPFITCDASIAAAPNVEGMHLLDEFGATTKLPKVKVDPGEIEARFLKKPFLSNGPQPSRD